MDRPSRRGHSSLKRTLSFFDVFAICTGAMISSGFFLLPGIAYGMTGPSVVLAYLIAGILIIPSLLSKAELASAMPKAGGTYYFLDRSFGSLVGTMSGLGTYLALVLKTALSLVGFGAYLVIFVGVPIKISAIVMALFFMLLNFWGAKESSLVQKCFVWTLLISLTVFILEGILTSRFVPVSVYTVQFSSFFSHGFEGFLSTIGFVFVSYIGLTKVASVSEEVKNPDITIPWGMISSLIVTSVIYVVTIFFVVSFCDSQVLQFHLNPILLLAEKFSFLLSPKIWRVIIVMAAIFAFLSTANAGLLSASRYPLAMSRDGVLPKKFQALNSSEMPFFSIFVTSIMIVVCVLFLDLVKIAKLASTFHLFIFILVNMAVIVMRESKIETYDPGFKMVLYPWIPLFGIFSSLLLILYQGFVPILFTLVLVFVGVFWHRFYVQPYKKRHGALYHWFYLLGKQQNLELNEELWDILRLKGVRKNDLYSTLIAKSVVIELSRKEIKSFKSLTGIVSRSLAQKTKYSPSELTKRFLKDVNSSFNYVIPGVCFPQFRGSKATHSELFIVRVKDGFPMTFFEGKKGKEKTITLYAFFYLIGSDLDPQRHLRLLAKLIQRSDSKSFLTAWRKSADIASLKQLLLEEDGVLELRIIKKTPSEHLIHKKIKDLKWPKKIVVVLIYRRDKIVFPRGGTRLLDNDTLIVIGQDDVLNFLKSKYI
ncbi:amino acid transporter [Candidatus Marinamargulisbacteria bacterium SCGC AG-439-L15]|nr:amino acid transporter [Candidatus Marinamargulisbacteria bacterium SCGC AG-439-L15]